PEGTRRSAPDPAGDPAPGLLPEDQLRTDRRRAGNPAGDGKVEVARGRRRVRQEVEAADRRAPKAMTEETNPSQQTELSQADAQAIDALIDARFDLSRVPQAEQARAKNVASVLSLLDGAVKVDSTLVDVTLARINRAGAPGHAESAEVVLGQDDAEALD